MLTVPRISSALATVVIDTFFYGIYLVLFFTSIYLLLTVQSRGLRRDRSIWLSPILLGGVLLFITVTGHWILVIDRLFLAFVRVDGGANPVGFYGDFSQGTQIAQTSFLLATLTIVDVLYVHRLWTVWGHNKYVMIFPMFTLLGLLVGAFGITYDFSQFKVGNNVVELANGWIIADCVFTVSTNLYCTVLIAWRLWRVQSILKPAGGRTLLSVLAIIVESAALSATWAVFFISAYASTSNLRFLIDVTPAIVGSTNMLIYVRVGLGWAHAPEPKVAASPATAIRFNTSKFNGGNSIDDYEDGYRKKQVELV
ncbi:hypothetical protein C8R44DRAFT_990906 [Mycena epipterygia]|nr:hypothetical protein C8R44DRAFT_990906 [Mycena epipterygia]